MKPSEQVLSGPQKRALAIVREHQPMTPRSFARHMWPDSPAWGKETRGRDNHLGPQGGTMPMRGARMLWALARKGLVRQDHHRQWRAT